MILSIYREVDVMNIIIHILLATLFLSSTIAYAASPPFKKGQIVVQGPSYQLSSLKVIKRLPLSDLTVFEVETGKEFGQVQRLRKQGLKAGFNYIAQASLTSNDTFYVYQWHLPKIQIEEAWDITRGALDGITPLIVAVLDTGINRGGADGINECMGGYDVVGQDDDPTDGSSLSHGTHVSGTIAQRTNFDPNISGVGVAGVAPEACVMPVKVLDDSGSGSFADIAEGIYYAVDNGAQVINMSLGVNARFGMTSDPFVDAALDYAEENEVLVVAAAGNDGHRKNVSYPAIYPTAVAVGATDYADQVVRYSNKGQGLDVVAPGGNTSADLNGDGYVDGVLQETSNEGVFNYYFLQGTSMASPHVAGLAALLYAQGATSVGAVRQAILSTSLDLGKAGFDGTFGHGLIQAYSALSSSEPVVGPPSAPSNPSPNNLDTDVAVDVTLSWMLADYALSYDVYLAPSGSALVKLGNTSSTSFSLSNLELDTLYDWQVVAINDNGITSGPLWSFTTVITADVCTDNDGDGYCSNVDCDDTNSSIYPGHQDSRGRWGRDGIDNDCNGIIDG